MSRTSSAPVAIFHPSDSKNTNLLIFSELHLFCVIRFVVARSSRCNDADEEVKVPFAKNTKLWKVPSVQSGEGQNGSFACCVHSAAGGLPNFCQHGSSYPPPPPSPFIIFFQRTATCRLNSEWVWLVIWWSVFRADMGCTVDWVFDIMYLTKVISSGTVWR